MTTEFIICAIYLLLCCGLFIYGHKTDDKTKTHHPEKVLTAILLAGFAVRRYFGLQDVSFPYDMSCFKAWADATTYYGLNQMYHSGMFLDYPPGYMYILWVLNFVQDLFRLDYNSVVYTFIIKLPAIIADLAGTVLIYKIAKDKLDEKWAVILSGCYAFCPALIYTSSIWGQIDSYYTLFMVLALYFISKDDVIKASLTYAIALITKPQALLFGPVLLLWVISKKDWKIFFKAVGTGLGAMWLMAIPFSTSLNPLWLVNLYMNTFNGYKYFTVNGYNLYMLADLNWKKLDLVPGAEYINFFVIFTCFIFCVWSYFKQKGEGKIFSTALIFICVFFSFCTMMHERYMHPAIILSLLTFIYTKNKGWLAVFLGAVATNYTNTVASMLAQCNEIYISSLGAKLISAGAIAVTVFAIYLSFSAARKGIRFEWKKNNKEIIAIGSLCLVYAIIAFFRLGATTAPQTFYQTRQAGEWFVYRFDKPQHVNQIWSYSGIGDQFFPQGDNSSKTGCEFDILVQTDNGVWSSVAELHHDYVFTWKKVDTAFTSDAIMVKAKSAGQVLNELILVNSSGEKVYGSIDSGSDFIFEQYSPYLAFDESHYLPVSEDDYYWSMYFDEIYHGRTAYEQLHGYSIYETTHPPLGKTIISIGIALFGMTPFGWRFMGTLRGVLMVALMYWFAKELLKNTTAAFITAFIFAFDFMHYTQTRLGTVDSYVVLFIMLMFMFMLKYSQIPLDEKPQLQGLYLLLSGISMGCAVSVKWNGAYSVIGLAIYFFISLFIKYKKYNEKTDNKKDGLKKVVVTCLWCVLRFVVIPCLIYFVTFIPVLHTEGLKNIIYGFVQHQIHMFNYHSKLVAEHFFSSLWYTWPVMVKPIWYSITRFGDMASSISAFGNPAVWLPMLPALIYVLIKGIQKKDTATTPIIAGYLASYLPWIAITRLAFIYHYFPATVFGILAIGYVFKDLLDKPKFKKYLWVYPVIVLVLFVVFFPVISGLPASAAYLDRLELLPTWYFN